MRNTSYALLWIISTSLTATAAEGIQWHGNLRTAATRAANGNLPILLHFSADWCGPCERLERDVFSNPQLAQLIQRHVVPVKVDIDRQTQLAEKFDISSVPTDVYLSPRGQLLSSGPSPRNIDDYLSTLRQLITHQQHAAVAPRRTVR